MDGWMHACNATSERQNNESDEHHDTQCDSPAITLSKQCEKRPNEHDACLGSPTNAQRSNTDEANERRQHEVQLTSDDEGQPLKILCRLSIDCNLHPAPADYRQCLYKLCTHWPTWHIVLVAAHKQRCGIQQAFSAQFPVTKHCEGVLGYSVPMTRTHSTCTGVLVRIQQGNRTSAHCTHFFIHSKFQNLEL